MRKNLFAASLIATTFASAQYVGVNTPTPKSTLDVTAKNPALATETQIDGVLVARISKSRAEAMGTTVPNANLVFVDDLTDPSTVSTTSLVTAKGFYYYETAQSKWIPLNFNANDWHTTGNGSTSVGTNFLGTTDNEPLMFKVNNTQGAFISSADEGAGNTAFGYGALANTTTSPNNVAIGKGALGSLTNTATTGANTAIGQNAMGQSSANARFNTAIGVNALSKATGLNNVAIGQGAAANVIKSSNIAIGGGALGGANVTDADTNISIGLTSMQSATTAYGNIALGYGAGNSITTGKGNVMLGSFAEPFDPTLGGQLNIANLIYGMGIIGGNTTSGGQYSPVKKVGIATKPSETFHVNGTARISELPVNGAPNAIYNDTDNKSATFTATKTVVADNNGVLGVVDGLPNSFASISKPREVTTSEITSDSNGSDGITLKAGCLNLMLDPYKSGAIYYIGLNAKIEPSCATGNVWSAVTALGGDSVNRTYQDFSRLNFNSTSFVSDGMNSRTMDNTPLINGRIALIDLGQVYEYTYYANWNSTKNVYQIGLEMNRIQ